MWSFFLIINECICINELEFSGFLLSVMRFIYLFITVPVATFFEYNINANNYGKLVTMQPYVPIFKKT